MEEQSFFLIVAVLLAYLVGCWGKTRKIGFWLAFCLSLLNVLIGIIAVALSKKLVNNNNADNITTKSY